MICPNCGHRISGNWTVEHTRTMENSYPLALPAPNNGADNIPSFSTAYRKTPYRKQEMIADVFVPLSQAIVTGLMAGVTSSILAIFIESWPGYIGLIIGPVVAGGVWSLAMLTDRGLWVIEKITGQDYEYQPEESQSQKRIVEIEIKEGPRTHIATLPGDDFDLALFCQNVANGGSFSERTAQDCGYGVTNFRKLRDTFISRRWGYWKNPDHPQQGIELTVSGKQIIRDLANSLLPPTLSPGDSPT